MRDLAYKYSISFYISCGFLKFPRYHFQLSILCLVSFYAEYHKNSFENFRTDVKIRIFPIPIFIGIRDFQAKSLHYSFITAL